MMHMAGVSIVKKNSYAKFIDCQITNNRAETLDPPEVGHCWGGGIYVGHYSNNNDCNVTLDNCIISGNTSGGGICIHAYNNVTLINCFINGNSGGGLNDDAISGQTTLINCSFIGNTGGGAQCTSNLTMTNCSFYDNSSRGLYLTGCNSAIVKNCTFAGNSSGGGVKLFRGNQTFENCIFSGNSASIGGGLYTVSSNASLINCLFYENSADQWGAAAGVRYSNLIFSNCTFIDNSAPNGDSIGCGLSEGGNPIPSNVQVTNSILWDGGDEIWNVSGSTILVAYSNIQSGWPENLSTNPLFVSGPLGDYYLSQTAVGQAVDSPCVDAGSDTAANLGMDSFTTRTDHLSDAGIIDMGYHYPLPHPADIDKDGDVDFVDYAILTSQLKQTPGLPSADIAPPCGDGKVDEKDLALLVDSWLWGK